MSAELLMPRLAEQVVTYVCAWVEMVTLGMQWSWYRSCSMEVPQTELVNFDCRWLHKQSCSLAIAKAVLAIFWPSSSTSVASASSLRPGIETLFYRPGFPQNSH